MIVVNLFGGLAKKFGSKNVLKHIQIICLDEPSLIKEIKGYIQEADKA